MTEILTESFCERCGTRYTFESAAPRKSRLGRMRTVSKGLRNFVMQDDIPLSEAMADARSEEERAATSHQLDAFHKTFNFCMTCRQYTCGNCWNTSDGRCLTCAPLPGMELLPAPEPAAVSFADIVAQSTAVQVEGEVPSNGSEMWPEVDIGADLLARRLGLDADEAAGADDAGEPEARAVRGIAPGESVEQALARYEAQLAAEEEAEQEAEAFAGVLDLDDGALSAEWDEDRPLAASGAEGSAVGDDGATGLAELAPIAEAAAGLTGQAELRATEASEAETVAAETVAAETVAAEAGAAEPVIGGEPVAAEVGEAETVAAEAGAAEPVIAAAVDAEPAAAEAGAAEPVIAAAVDAEPAAAEVGAAEPVVAAAVDADPTATEAVDAGAAEPVAAEADDAGSVIADAGTFAAGIAAGLVAGGIERATPEFAGRGADAEPVVEPAPDAEPERAAPEPVAAGAFESEPEPLAAESEPVAAAAALEPEPTAAELQPDFVVPEPESIAAAAWLAPAPPAPPQSDMAAAAPGVDIVSQPTWPVAPPPPPQTAPQSPAPTPAPQPEAPAAPANPWLTVAPDESTREPQWPISAGWGRTTRTDVPTTLAGRQLLPRDDAAALWAASAQEVIAGGPGVAAVSGAAAAPVAPQPCVSCGLSLSANARFCRRCGTRQG